MGTRGAIFGLTIFLLLAAQCFAVCSVVPCSLPQKASCHHEGAEKAPCVHEGFVTEGASKPDVAPVVIVSAPVPDMAASRAVDVSLAPLDLATPDLPSISVLRI
jgi:hypothetical protein